MRIINVKACDRRGIPIGRVGENMATDVVFDVSDLLQTYGDGQFSLLHQRSGDAQPYPVALTRDGSDLHWIVGSADVAVHGEGSAELILTKGEQIAKSIIYPTYTAQALGTAAEPPEPWEAWVEEVLQAGAAALSAAGIAVEAKDIAVDARNDAENFRDETRELKDEAAAIMGTATFRVDAGSGELLMTFRRPYYGAEFNINENGYLEVTA